MTNVKCYWLPWHHFPSHSRSQFIFLNWVHAQEATQCKYNSNNQCFMSAAISSPPLELKHNRAKYSTWCLPPCGSTSWPAQSSPAAHTQRFAGGNAPWPLPHPDPLGAPPSGNACPLQRSALGCQSAAWGRKEWPADESGSAERGMLGCKCPNSSRQDRQEKAETKHWEIRAKIIHVHGGFTFSHIPSHPLVKNIWY